MRLDISRPVLITHFAPRDCRSPRSRCNFSGTGGFSNSANSVPSKSVEINLIGKFTLLHCLRDGGFAHTVTSSMNLQEQYDDAMFDFSSGGYDNAIARLRAILAEDPSHFEAQLALGMAFYRKGDCAAAIAEGHKAEKLKPNEQLVHTNLSLF